MPGLGNARYVRLDFAVDALNLGAFSRARVPGTAQDLTISKKVSVSRNVYYVNSQRYSRPFWYEYGQSRRRCVVIGKGPYLHRTRRAELGDSRAAQL